MKTSKMMIGVIALMIMMSMFLFPLTGLAAGFVSVSDVNMSVFVQDIYTWELEKSCNIDGPVILPIDETKEVEYVVKATRNGPVAEKTIVITAKVAGAETATVIYNNESYEVPVQDGKIILSLPYVKGKNGCTVKIKNENGNAQATISKGSLKEETKAPIGETAILMDAFGPILEGLADYVFSDEYQSERELLNSAEFTYTVIFENESSYAETHSIVNTATLIPNGAETIEEAASFEITTPPEEEPGGEEPGEESDEEEPGKEPDEDSEKPDKSNSDEGNLPRTDGDYGVFGFFSMIFNWIVSLIFG